MVDDGYSIPVNAAIAINGNSFGTMSSFAVAWESGYAGPVLDASANWWGDNTLAGIQPKIDQSGGPVDFTPWLDTGTPLVAGTCNGFSGDFSVLHVSAASPQAGMTGRIQEGINDVVGGKVIIEAGHYAENVLANKANLELAGVGQGLVTIVPALSSPNPCPGGGSLCGGESDIILVQASSVTIHDVTLNGDNTNLTSSVNIGGSNIDARNGIIEDYNQSNDAGVFNNTVVYNTTVENIYLRGIYASSGGTGFFFHDNTVQNVQADPSSVAMFNFGGSGVMSNNIVSNAGDAIAANWSTSTSFLNNTVTASGSAVHTDNSSGPDVLAGNNASAMQAGAYGVWVFSPYGSVVISNNVVSGCAAGLVSAGQGAVVTPLFINNQVAAGAGAGSVGVYETTSLFGFGFSDVSSAFQGNTVQGTTYGFYLEDTSANNLSAAITANNIVTNNQYGVYATGAPEFVKIENTDLRSNTGAGIYATGGATVDAGNCGADVTGLGDSAGGNNLTGYLTGAAQAVVNNNSGGSPAVYAYSDSFGATALQPEITSALTGTVLASQGGGLLALSPTAVTVQCAGNLPVTANTLAAFQTQGGVVSATAVSVSAVDGTLNPGPYDGNIIRTYTLTDACSHTKSVQQTITVYDTTPPVITQCAPNVTNNADATAHALLPDLTGAVIATDNCVGPITVSQSPLPNTSVGLGVTVVTLTATDASGNPSLSCTATVTVKDVTPPTITCPPDVTVTVLQDKDPYATGTAIATDAGASQESEPITITYTDNPNGLTNCDATGQILRTWIAVDPSGNTNTCTQTITVIDNTAPLFTFVPANITMTNDPGQCSAVVSYVTPTATDVGYFQRFETTNWMSSTNGQSLDWTDGNSHMARVPSGTDGINASSGSAYAVIDSTVPEAGPDYTSSGAVTFLDGITMSVSLDHFRLPRRPLGVIHVKLSTTPQW